jgi:hypothetical protein
MLQSDYQLLHTQDSQAHRRYDLFVVRQRQPKKRGGTHGTQLLYDALLIRKLEEAIKTHEVLSLLTKCCVK